MAEALIPMTVTQSAPPHLVPALNWCESSDRTVPLEHLLLLAVPPAVDSGKQFWCADTKVLSRMSEQLRLRYHASEDDGLQVFTVMLFMAYMYAHSLHTYSEAIDHLQWVADRVRERESEHSHHLAAALREVPRLLLKQGSAGCPQWEKSVDNLIQPQHKSLCCCLAVFVEYCSHHEERAFALLREVGITDDESTKLLRNLLQ